MLEIKSITLFDLCYVSVEIFFFFSLIFILLQYSIQIQKIIRIQHYFLQNTIGNISIESFLILNKKLNIGLLLVINKLIKIFKFSIFLILINPLLLTTTKYLFTGFFISTPAIVFLKLIIFLSAIIILRSNFIYFIIENNRNGDSLILFGFIVFSLLLFLQVADFFILFLMFELIAILFYIVLALQKNNVRPFLLTQGIDLTKYQKILLFSGNANENLNNLYSILASLTYFLLNTIVTALFLFALSCLLLIFQTTNFLTLAILLQFKLFNYNFPLLFFAVVSILCVFFFKLSIVPFHWWIPAVFEGAPYISIMFLAIPVKLCVIFILIKVLYLVFSSLFFIWQPILIIGALLSMIIGTLGLFFQTKLKKFWAYSTINHMGYMLLALSTNSWIGIRAVFIYFSAYILMNFGFFIMCLVLTNDSLQQRITTINQLIYFKQFKYTITALFFSLIIFSLIGIPPLFGFWGKYFVLVCVLTTHKSFMIIYILAIIIITSLIATASYLKIWKTIFIEDIYKVIPYNFKAIPITIEQLRYLFIFCFFLIIGPLFCQGNFLIYLDFFIKSILVNLF